MTVIDAFKKDGKWFKGNLHCHSTNSDGALPPAKVAAIYKNNGWNFLAFTDHEFYTDSKEYNDDNFIVIPGTELCMDYIRDPHTGKLPHIVGIAKTGLEGGNAFKHGDKFPKKPGPCSETAQTMITNLITHDHLAILCHPNWSRLEFDDIKNLTGYFAMEIFNYGCFLESNTGLCTAHWDSLLRSGKKVWGVATDDAHHIVKDQCGGWVMVKAEKLSCEAISAALAEGSFYSSSGPEIHELTISGNEVRVECSPVNAIHFMTCNIPGKSFWATEGNSLTSSSYRLNGDEKYVRVECVDLYGKTAWSNPIFLNRHSA